MLLDPGCCLLSLCSEGDAGKDEPTSPGLAKGKVGRSFARHVAAQSERYGRWARVPLLQLRVCQ